jgi:hypothetical protein
MSKQTHRSVGFRLLGHDCPYGLYPAPVIPVGEQPDGTAVAIYPGGAGGPTPQPIDRDAEFVVHSRGLSTELGHFDWLTDRLFAYEPGDVVRYAADGEWRFLAELFGSPRLANADPYVRLMLAKHTRQRRLILREIGACYADLMKTDRDSADAWRAHELALLPQEVFVSFSPDPADSLATNLVVRGILKTKDLGPSFMLPDLSDAKDEAGVSALIRAASIFAAILGPKHDAGGDNSNDVYYQIGNAAALGKPTLLLTTGTSGIPVEVRRGIVIEYDPLEIEDSARAQRLSARVASALSDLRVRAAEEKAADVRGTEAFREQVKTLYSFATGVESEGKVLMPVVKRVFQIVCGHLNAPAGADFRDSWEDYQRLHSNRMAHYLNGGVARANESFALLPGNAVDNGVSRCFQGLRTHLTDYQRFYQHAYESAGRYLESSKPEPNLFTAIDKVDQTLQNVTNDASKLMEALVTTILPPDSTTERDAHA